MGEKSEASGEDHLPGSSLIPAEAQLTGCGTVERVRPAAERAILLRWLARSGPTIGPCRRAQAEGGPEFDKRLRDVCGLSRAGQSADEPQGRRGGVHGCGIRFYEKSGVGRYPLVTAFSSVLGGRADAWSRRSRPGTVAMAGRRTEESASPFRISDTKVPRPLRRSVVAASSCNCAISMTLPIWARPLFQGRSLPLPKRWNAPLQGPR